MHKIMKATISILLFFVLIAPASANGQVAAAMPAWQADWNASLAAAKKEGRVIVYTGYGAGWRAALTESMSRKYGINVDVITATSSQIAERVMREQRTKTYHADVIVVGSSQFLLTFQPAGVLQSLERALILPEVVDPKAWWRGKLPWLDPDTKTYFQFYEYVTPPIVVNTNLVGPEEITSWKDLLNPKWKDRLILNDPTVSGSGQKTMTMLAGGIMNWDYINDLVRQKPTLVRDLRQMVEWVAREKFPVVIAANKETVFDFTKVGAPLKLVVPSEGAYLDASYGFVSHPKGAPHPNAAKILMNFLLTQEGQTLSSRATGHQSTRVDVPTDHLESIIVRQPGMKYISTTDRDFLVKEVELKKKVTEIFKPLLK